MTFFLSLLLMFFSQPLYAESTQDNLLNSSSFDKEFQVTRVLTADTIELSDKRVVKLIGLKAPKAPKPKIPKKEYIFRDDFGTYVDEPVSPLSTIEENALNFAKSLLENKTVRLESDIEHRGIDSYIQVYAFLKDGTFVNAEILRNGYAELNIVPPNTKYAEKLREAYLEAKKELRGLYGE